MSFTFKWAHPAEEVFVTGTFDKWSKSEQLTKKGDVFEKTVSLPKADGKILYKFVADGKWLHDHTAQTESDHEGNVNNVLYPHDLTPASAAISSVAPGATTTDFAGQQPHATSGLPGAFPETPAVSTANEDKTLSINPIPASAGAGNPVKLAPGEKVPEPSTINDNSITSAVHDDPELKAADAAKSQDQTLSVNPIPATGGSANPIQLRPGEKVPDPSTITTNTINSNVKLDKASYEKSDAGAPFSAAAPRSGGAVIPESGLPIGALSASASDDVGPTISSAGPSSTTSQLAGAVPKEPRGVPEVVGESQQEAHVAPEASANPEAVVEKREVEQELKQKVPVEPATSESGLIGKREAGVVGLVAGGLAAASAASAAAINSVAPNSTTAALASQVDHEPRGVPEVVEESQKEAHASPEASANPVALKEKSEVEKELKKAVPEASATSESGLLGKNEGGVVAAAVTGGIAAAAGAAYTARQKATEATGKDPVSVLPNTAQATINQNQPAVTSATITDVSRDTGIPQQFAAGEPVKDDGAAAARQTTHEVPQEVIASQKEAHASPEASANSEAVKEKEDVERELLKKVKTVESAGAPAPSSTAALTETVPGTKKTSASGAPQLDDPVAGVAPIDLDGKDGLNATKDSPAVPPTAKENSAPGSGSVSPMTKPDEPTVTTGVGSARVPRESAPEKRQSFVERLRGTPESSKTSTSEDGKKKRRSFFGKLKDKLKA